MKSKIKMPNLLALFYAFTLLSDYLVAGHLPKWGTFFHRLFLKGDSNMGAEEIMRIMDPDVHSNEEVDGFKEPVLTGNYGRLGPPVNGMMMIQKSELNSMDEGGMAGRSITNEANEESSDPNKLIELKPGNHYPMGVVMGGIEAIVEAEKNLGDKSPNHCLSKLAMCSLIPASSYACMLNCWPNVKSDAAVQKLSHLLTQTLNTMCDSIGTVFDKIIDAMDNRRTEIKRVSTFMGMFKINNHHFKSYAYKAADALLMQILNNIEAPQLARYRIGIQSMARALAVADKGFKGHIMMSNPGCKSMNYINTAKQYLDMFNQKPAMTDMLFGGYTLARTVSNHVPGPQHAMFRSFDSVFNSVLGVTCGIENIFHSADDQADCDITGAGLIVTIPNRPEYRSADPYKGACLTVPEFPSFDMNMGFKLPNSSMLTGK